MKRNGVVRGILTALLGLFTLTGAALAQETPAQADKAKPPGREMFIKYKCQSCHSVGAQGLKKKAVAADEEEGATATATSKRPPDLSAVGVERTPAWIVKYLQKLETIKGKKHIKKFKG